MCNNSIMYGYLSAMIIGMKGGKYVRGGSMKYVKLVPFNVEHRLY
jgi:hypothetical protein